MEVALRRQRGYRNADPEVAVQRALGVSGPTIYKCINKALAAGVVTGLHDRYDRANAPQISAAAKAWVHDARPRPIYTVSVDEKPGVQALSTTGADLPPVAGKHASVGRDYEYVRHGTLSIIAALDLHTGEIIANVESRHRSVELIGLLRRLDEHDPSEAVIRVVL